MSQSVTFYLVKFSDFKKLESDLDQLSTLLQSCERYTLGGTHIGIQYLLNKCSPENANIIQMIFAPTNFELGDKVFDLEPFYFHDDKTIEKIGHVLENVEEEQLLSVFNAGEMNAAKVYPMCWNETEGRTLPYNKEHLLLDYSVLKTAFRQAQRSKDYMLCFVG